MDDGSVSLPAHTCEHVVPNQGCVIERLTVVAVFDIQINKISLFALIEGKIVFSYDAYLRYRIAAIEAHPVITVVFIDI